ncbi:MAG: hypothetical protein ACP5M0_06990 [Desulfomonilaceae bacterium]
MSHGWEVVDPVGGREPPDEQEARKFHEGPLNGDAARAKLTNRERFCSGIAGYAACTAAQGAARKCARAKSLTFQRFGPQKRLRDNSTTKHPHEEQHLRMSRELIG